MNIRWRLWIVHPLILISIMTRNVVFTCSTQWLAADCRLEWFPFRHSFISMTPPGVGTPWVALPPQYKLHSKPYFWLMFMNHEAVTEWQNISTEKLDNVNIEKRTSFQCLYDMKDKILTIFGEGGLSQHGDNFDESQSKSHTTCTVGDNGGIHDRQQQPRLGNVVVSHAPHQVADAH